MVVSETRNGVESDYISDTLGSTIGLMDSAGVMTDRWEYWPQGEVVSRTGTNPTPLTFLGILGYFQDVLSKLFYVRARHLRVDLARWLTVDPLWPTTGAYVYCEDAAVGCSDSSGLASCPPTQITSSEECSLPWNSYQQCSQPTFGKAVLCCSTGISGGAKNINAGCCTYLCRSWSCSCTYWLTGQLADPRNGVDITYLYGPAQGYCVGDQCVSSLPVGSGWPLN